MTSISSLSSSSLRAAAVWMARMQEIGDIQYFLVEQRVKRLVALEWCRTQSYLMRLFSSCDSGFSCRSWRKSGKNLMEGEIVRSPKFLILPLVQPDINDEIDFDYIRTLTANGLDAAQPEDRCLAWLILLNLYPRNAHEWTDVLATLVGTYDTYMKEVKLEHWINEDVPVHVPKEDFNCENVKLMALIHGDLIRTGRHICMLPPAEVQSHEYKDGENTILLYSLHLRRLERILYIVGSINKAMSYMQGFNELLVPIYYTIYMARSLFSDENVVEALSFHCLHQLLSQTRINELFTTQDQSFLVKHQLSLFSDLCKVHVPDAAQRIADLQIHPLCYCYRWFTLMFSQEYELPSLQQIWDAIFTHFDDLLNYIFYLGLAHIKMWEDQIMNKKYEEVIEMLQGSSVWDVYTLLKTANHFWKIDHDPSLVDQVHNVIKGVLNFVLPKK